MFTRSADVSGSTPDTLVVSDTEGPDREDIMIQPTAAFIVTAGVYDDYRVLAVFTEHQGAQEYADHYNLTGPLYSREDDKARVEDIDLYGPGWRRPTTTEVIDGEILDDEYDEYHLELESA
jgi:hypothetical protein